MEIKEENGLAADKQMQTELPAYEPPKIVTYTSEQILEQIGPAMACSPTPCTMP